MLRVAVESWMCEVGAVKTGLRIRAATSLIVFAFLGACVGLSGCAQFHDPLSRGMPRMGADGPLTASRALAQGDAQRVASLRLVIAGLDEDEGGRPSRASAGYQRAIQVDSTNPFAYLALARHHLEYGHVEKAAAFLDQARSLFEAEGQLGPEVDVWGIGLRAWVDRGIGRDSLADSRFEAARQLSSEIWADELLSAGELR